MTARPLPDNRAGILDQLVSSKIISPREGGRYHVTNLGAILFAVNLKHFDRLSRKALRVILYKGKSRVETVREQVGIKGYAPGFERAITYINDLLPMNEEIGKALRKEVRMYPQLAIRELVANALIHQDFTLTGTGPMVEIFLDRIEITNPGTPLLDPLRFIDEPARSRNEDLARFMRLLNICEERGSGIDKVITQVELFQLPAPDFSVTANHTKAILFAHKDYGAMSKSDRIRACYQHAVLRYISGEFMTNASLRERFGIVEKNYSMVSRVISATITENLIRPLDAGGGTRRHAKYVPYWA